MQGKPEDSHTKSGNAFFLLLLYLSEQTHPLFFSLTCRHLPWRRPLGPERGCRALSHCCVSWRVVVWDLFISLSFAFWGESVGREVVMTQLWGPLSRAHRKAVLECPHLIIAALGTPAAEWHLMVNMCKVLGGLHLCFVATNQKVLLLRFEATYFSLEIDTWKSKRHWCCLVPVALCE